MVPTIKIRLLVWSGRLGRYPAKSTPSLFDRIGDRQDQTDEVAIRLNGIHMMQGNPVEGEFA